MCVILVIRLCKSVHVLHRIVHQEFKNLFPSSEREVVSLRHESEMICDEILNKPI